MLEDIKAAAGDPRTGRYYSLPDRYRLGNWLRCHQRGGREKDTIKLNSGTTRRACWFCLMMKTG